MAKFKKKPVVIEAITFNELVAHGTAQAPGTVVNGMPWSFEYAGHPITHENDDCYLIPTLEGTMGFNRGDMLITGIKGEIYPCRGDIFKATYEPVDERWFSGRVMCVKCSHRWVAVASVTGDEAPRNLECPACHETAGHPTKEEA